MQSQSGFTGTFRAVDFDNAATRQATDAQADIQPNRAGGNRLDFNAGALLPQFHDRAFAERSFNLPNRSFDRFCFVHLALLDQSQFCCRHRSLPYFIAPPTWQSIDAVRLFGVTRGRYGA
jgi:hypothetical protein